MMDVSAEAGRCVQVLQQGGVILFPADTGWCLGCDATSDKAVERMLQLMPAHPGTCQVLVAEERDVLLYTAAPDLALFDYLAEQQQPVTVVYDDPLGIATDALRPDGSVAMRMVQDAFCRHLVRRLRKPVACVPAQAGTAIVPVVVGGEYPQIQDKVDYAVPQQGYRVEKMGNAMLIRWDNGQPFALDG